MHEQQLHWHSLSKQGAPLLRWVQSVRALHLRQGHASSIYTIFSHHRAEQGAQNSKGRGLMPVSVTHPNDQRSKHSDAHFSDSSQRSDKQGWDALTRRARAACSQRARRHAMLWSLLAARLVSAIRCAAESSVVSCGHCVALSPVLIVSRAKVNDIVMLGDQAGEGLSLHFAHVSRARAHARQAMQHLQMCWPMICCPANSTKEHDAGAFLVGLWVGCLKTKEDVSLKETTAGDCGSSPRGFSRPWGNSGRCQGHQSC